MDLLKLQENLIFTEFLPTDIRNSSPSVFLFQRKALFEFIVI